MFKTGLRPSRIKNWTSRITIKVQGLVSGSMIRLTKTGHWPRLDILDGENIIDGRDCWTVWLGTTWILQKQAMMKCVCLVFKDRHRHASSNWCCDLILGPLKSSHTVPIFLLGNDKGKGSLIRDGIKKKYRFFGRSFPNVFTHPPTPGFLWDLGKQKVKFGSKKAIFGVICFF